MDTQFSAEDLAFRDEVRQFFQENCSAELRARLASKKTSREAQVEWQKCLYERGWIAPGWPVEHGGTGWTATQKFIFESERTSADAPDVIPFGLKMVGPVIYTFGTEEQQAKFLPRILRSDDWWCQGYSEPGAGSDLAALKTKAELDGDEYLVNGAKIWTSGAHLADWIFCLVRTDSSGKKQEGISFLLIDMKTPGITVNPIIGLDGGHSLNEVQFNEVRVPAENLIGEQDKGWTYAKALLQHERTAIAGVAGCKRVLARVIAYARAEGGLIDDPAFQRRLSDAEIEIMALEYTELRVLAALSAGTAPGPESSLLKIKGTELQQAVQELWMEVAGYYQGVLPDADGVDHSGHEFGSKACISYMYGRATTVYGGSNEVQKNIISKAVLGL
ncbi:MAG: acyl-CoA dehydrogenase family protein [Gammaproteobacteria bacterium]|nr:acyl-CoA dehydrogenase family protein [Gammaproteobacteria bacterium]